MTGPGSRTYGHGCARRFAAALRRALSPVLLLSGELFACSGEQVLGDYPPSTCDLSEVPESTGEKLPLTIASFWEKDENERIALKALTDLVDAQRFLVAKPESQTRIDVQLHIKNAFERQQLPDVFQANGGSDVLRWVAKRSGESTAVCALDSLGDREGWSGVYFPSVLAPISCRGQLFALPVGVHHLNVLFYNHDLYAALQAAAQKRKLNLAAPSELHSVEELLAQLKLIDELGFTAQNGKRLVPLALATNERWPLAILAFENVLLSLSLDAYKMLWEGGLTADGGHSPEQLKPILEQMLEVLRATVLRYSDLSKRLIWQDALRQVGDGAAVFTVTGDWGWAQLSDEQREHVTTVTFPGTAGTFVYTPDTFAVPRELGKNGYPARAFLHDVVFQKEALIEFAKVKYSIPPRGDLSDDEVDELGAESIKRTYRDFQDCERGGCELQLAVSGLAPPPGVGPCFDDIDALLTLAVTEIQPTDEQRTELSCPEQFPATSDDAAVQVVELLLKVAEQRFASDCR